MKNVIWFIILCQDGDNRSVLEFLVFQCVDDREAHYAMFQQLLHHPRLKYNGDVILKQAIEMDLPRWDVIVNAMS